MVMLIACFYHPGGLVKPGLDERYEGYQVYTIREGTPFAMTLQLQFIERYGTVRFLPDPFTKRLRNTGWLPTPT